MGDEIMVTGEARVRAAGTSRRFAVQDVRHKQRWHEAWEGNPRIARLGEKYDDVLRNAPGNRPYILFKTGERWVWRAYKPPPGELFLTGHERTYSVFGEGSIVIQPAIKLGASPNKAWPVEYWHTLVAMGTARGHRFVQVGAGSEQRIKGARFVTTPTMRTAFGVLAGARAAVLQEGGLHHAAAALGVRAVVVFGGFISPACTGYESHVNLFRTTRDSPLGCGMRLQCPHCMIAMRNFTPQLVLEKLETIL